MSLMFMLFALLGAVVVLGGGSYALRGVLAHMEARAEVPEPKPPPRAVPDPHVGGYVPVRGGADARPAPSAGAPDTGPDDRPGNGPPSDALPGDLRARVRDLVALDRTDDAVRMVRERLGGDERRARGLVRGLGGEERPALEP
ncbi:hypothetical protein [Nocardiopsis sp. NPDC006938]|uniref:hypothetical protein n=1 Tax=Nocardiopsis sp. NPDC006938 TaxID=3364337 RepID=UPI00369755B3